MKQQKSDSTHMPVTNRMGNWLPTIETAALWLAKTKKEAKKKKRKLDPSVRKFKNLIETDPIINMYFTQMFQQQPTFAPPAGSGDVKIENYQEMLLIMNHVLTTAPEYNTTGMVGFPINAILDFPMITPAGLAAFADEKVNKALKRILKKWNKYLDSPDSLYVLNTGPNGWMSKSAYKALQMQNFIHDPKKPFWGFKSWNDFFIREFKSGKRPVASPKDKKVIVSACESAPLKISANVQKTNQFWIKGQPYSLEHMLDGNHVDYYVGGTVYQAYLSAENYHRWHTPIDGTIVDIKNIDGTYYSEAASEGFDPAGPNNSQGYLAQVAARALIFIESGDPKLGMVCVMPIGMAEVSSCLITVKKGDKVKKGEQIGYFQFGGSTHCVLFQKGAIANFSLPAIPQGTQGEDSKIVPINSEIAVAN
ncbi:Phosphatidylserine decarboxylase proenzyme [Kordia antarctica]|uniref:Phosphatidylserine decarboxylase proenzyme n=1 Tax=Kordia antarctica TaxID=1218801 RepID=A0A7L4ZMT8_9FLAO|nr:phosphatidylserine decarboxylase family protein [Kordia antarctica]QHI37797.1 Phosphatidylserine decarboxylase proenzyme [Kordia antarctica]